MVNDGYRNITVKEEPADRSRKDFEILIKPQYPKMTFATWLMNVSESALDKEEILKKNSLT